MGPWVKRAREKRFSFIRYVCVFCCCLFVFGMYTTYMSCTLRGQKRVPDTLGYRSWVLGTEPLAFAKVASVLTAEPFLQPQEILVIFTYLLLFCFSRWFFCVVIAVVELTL